MDDMGMMGQGMGAGMEIPEYAPMPVADAPMMPEAVDTMRQEADAAAYRAELLAWSVEFFKKSKAWRESSFEDKWRLYQRNSDAIYDPTKKKESWQSKAFMGLTPSHRESAQAQLFKTQFGARPLLSMKPRVDSEAYDQGDNIRDLILRDMEKGEFEVESNSVLEDCTTFGSGFARIRFEEKSEVRRVRRPEYAEVPPGDPRLAAGKLPPAPEVIGYSESLESVQSFRGVRFEYLSIWDIYPDPKALKVGQGPIIYRYRLTYGEILEGVAKGYYNRDCAERLRSAEATEKEPIGKAGVLADRDIQDDAPNRPSHAKVYECYELWAKLPQKWVLPPEAIQGDPETLVPARVNFHQDCVLSQEVSEEYAGEAPIYKMDYWPLNNQFYGRGIPEMLKDYQELVNETVNQRIDNVALILNKQFAVIEKAMLYPQQDATSKPGNIIRLDGKVVQDVRQALMEIPVSDIMGSAYKEIFEYERGAQERTKVNRITLGTAGQVKDANQTLGGMELISQSSGDQFAYIGMLQEFSWLRAVARAYYRAIYAHIEPKEVIEALGPERASKFRLMTPEEVEGSYFFIPQGVYTMENKALRQARVDAIYKSFALEPFVDKIAFFDRELKDAGEDPSAYRLSPEEAQAVMMAQAVQQQTMAAPPVGEGPEAEVEADAMPKKKKKSKKSAADTSE